MSAWWLCFTYFEEQLEQNLLGNRCFWLWWWLLLQWNNCFSNFGEFVHVHVQFFLTNSVSTIRHRGISYWTSKAGQGNNQDWKGPGQSEDWIDPVSQTKSQSLTGVLISSNCSRIRFLLKRHNKNVTTFCSRVFNNRSLTLKLWRWNKNCILMQLDDMETPVIWLDLHM